VNKFKLIAFAVFAICGWLAFGAASLHQKDVEAGVRETSTAYHSINTPLVLAVFSLIAIGYVLFGKSKPKIGLGPKPSARAHL
jgi:hypothetical protein